jgi:hypothetical protein
MRLRRYVKKRFFLRMRDFQDMEFWGSHDFRYDRAIWKDRFASDWAVLLRYLR